MAEILESSRHYKDRISKENQDSACPECGYNKNLANYYMQAKGFIFMKCRHVYVARCKCGCEYRYYGQWE